MTELASADPLADTLLDSAQFDLKNRTLRLGFLNLRAEKHCDVLLEEVLWHSMSFADTTPPPLNVIGASLLDDQSAILRTLQQHYGYRELSGDTIQTLNENLLLLVLEGDLVLQAVARRIVAVWAESD